jgi:hypothetical protein
VIVEIGTDMRLDSRVWLGGRKGSDMFDDLNSRQKMPNEACAANPKPVFW